MRWLNYLAVRIAALTTRAGFRGFPSSTSSRCQTGNALSALQSDEMVRRLIEGQFHPIAFDA